MSDGFEIGGAIPILHEESLIVFQAVRSSGYRVLKKVSVVILHHLPHPLLEVGRGNYTQVCRGAHSRGVGAPVRRLHHRRENRIAAVLAGQYDLELVPLAVFGNYGTEGLITALITACRLK